MPVSPFESRIFEASGKSPFIWCPRYTICIPRELGGELRLSTFVLEDDEDNVLEDTEYVGRAWVAKGGGGKVLWVVDLRNSLTRADVKP